MASKSSYITKPKYITSDKLARLGTATETSYLRKMVELGASTDRAKEIFASLVSSDKIECAAMVGNYPKQPAYRVAEKFEITV